MEGKGRKENAGFDAPLVVGVVGHCDLEKLSSFRRLLDEFEGLDIVFFKTSSGHLWIKEGEEPENRRWG